MRQIDLATGSIVIRPDVPGLYPPHPGTPYTTINQETQIHRSADGSRLYFLGSNVDAGPIFTYSAVTNSFGPSAETGEFLHFASAAVNRNGSLLVTRYGYPNSSSVDTAPDFKLVQTLPYDSGVAFDAVSDIVYGVESTDDQIIAYDTNSLAEKYRLSIGEDVEDHSTTFGTGTLVASNDGRFLALETATGIRFFALPAPGSPPAPASTGTHVFGLPRDMVFDHSGKYLYITTYTGLVWPFNLLARKFEMPYDLGGPLNGVDIAPDDSYLLVGQTKTGLTQGVLHKITLSTGALTNIPVPGKAAVWDVAIASNGSALFDMAGYGPIRQVDLATNAITIRNDGPNGAWPGLYPSTPIQRSADGTRICFLEYGLSSRFVYTYDAVSNAFGPNSRNMASTAAAISRDGSLLANTRTNPANLAFDDHASLTKLPDFSLVHGFSGINSGVAFGGVQDVFYGVNITTDEIIGYNTQTFTETMRVTIGEDVPAVPPQPYDVGTLVASQEGRYLAFRAPSAIRIYDLATGTSMALSTRPPLGNISTRATVGTGDNAPIGGFIITGTDPKTLVLRALGPSLAAAGITGPLMDPTLELHDQSGAVIAFNDNWKDAQETAIHESGLAPTNDHEAVLIATLTPGTYTAVLRGKADTTGVGVVEIYDVDPNTNSKLGNISTRGSVGTGDNVMIAGLIIRTVDHFPVELMSPPMKEILIRGIGPSLSQFNVPDPLQNPMLELYDANGVMIRLNFDWSPFDVEGTGLTPTDKRESVIKLSLYPGNYTAILRGENNTTGVGVVEVYGLQ